MVKYLIKTEIAGVLICLIESEWCFCVIYGMQKETFDKGNYRKAISNYNACVSHAMECEGYSK